MSTGNMPNPPDHLTTQATANDTAGQTSETPPAPNETGSVPTLGQDIARVIREHVDVIAQRLVYHSQMMYGVGGVGTDPVSARLSTQSLADTLAGLEGEGQAVHSLYHLGDAQITQVNDRTMPYRFHVQAAGLLEGIVADTIAQAYRDDPERAAEAKLLLNHLFMEANDLLQTMPKGIAMFQAPAAGDEPLLTEPAKVQAT